MSVDYDKIPTERLNPRAKNLGRIGAAAALRLMDAEDARMLSAVRRAGPAVVRAVELIVRRMSAGGRLFFAGAGTSGRLGVLEAAECPPTFGTKPSQVQALMAGGRMSVFKSKEGAEDKGADAASLVRRSVRREDVLVGSTASGVTAFALTAIAAARRIGAGTVLLTCNPRARAAAADVTIVAATGPEVVAGSTRLKAGTATKLVMNRLTTLAMVRLGRTHGPYMANLLPRSKKLVARARRLVRLGVRKKIFTLLLALAAAAGTSSATVLTGLEVMERRGFDQLKGKRVGVICNHTAVDAKGRHLLDLLRRAEGVSLAAVFVPEHGFAGTLEHGAKVEDGFTPDGIPIHSLYGDTKRPTQEMLKGLDVLVFDMQDVGARFYTYITTMGYAIEEAARADIEMIVLDRPNPLGGAIVEGENLEDGLRHFTAYYSIPVRHGMTVGEIALWHNATAHCAKLSVIPMKGWSRGMPWRKTGLRFRAPSPNIPSPSTALLYSGIGAFEATNVAVGRGTKIPFQQFGAPWMDGAGMAAGLNAAGMPGVRFEPAVFTPSKDRYKGEKCSGVRVKILDTRTIRPVEIFVRAAFMIRGLHPEAFQPRWPEMPRVTGSSFFEEIYKTPGTGAEDYLKKIRADDEYFLERRAKFLLYE